MQKKKRQHYVWRSYLKAWSENGHIWVSNNLKVQRKGLATVGQKRYFYKVKEMTEADINFLKILINVSDNSSLKAANLRFIYMFSAIFKLKALLNAKQISNAEFERKFKILEVNLEENFHSKIETKSTKYLELILAEDNRFFRKNRDCFAFLHFLSLQYMRTSNMQKRHYHQVKPIGDENITSMWPALRHILSLNLATSIYLDRENHHLIILKNNSDTEFITGDQPVINTYSITSNGQDGLEFYYPVSPKIAILVTEKNEYKTSDTINLNKNEVMWFNQAIVESSD